MRRTMRAAGCITLMCLRIVAPSFVMTTSPLAVVIILSIPRGPRDVRTASATAARHDERQLPSPSPELASWSYPWQQSCWTSGPP